MQPMTASQTLAASAALVALLLSACSSSIPSFSQRDSIDPPLPDYPLLQHPREEDGKVVIRIKDRSLPHLDKHITRLPAGPRTLLVITDAIETAADQPGQGAIALWLRGRGSQRAHLPQFSSGRVNPSTRQDWDVELPPGDYLLGISFPPERSTQGAILQVR